MAHLIPLSLVQLLPLPRPVDRGDLLAGLHDVRLDDRLVPVDPLGGVPLLVLAPLVQVQQPLPPVVVLPGESGRPSRGDVPGALVYRRRVQVMGTHDGLLGGANQLETPLLFITIE